MNKVLVRDVQDQGDAVKLLHEAGRTIPRRGDASVLVSGLFPSMHSFALFQPITHTDLLLLRALRAFSILLTVMVLRTMESQKPSERSLHCSSHDIHPSNNTLGALTYPNMPATIDRSDLDRRQHCLGV